ncbi:Acetyltransferase (GNAT) family protein [compost metagenome]|uniref:Ribosomal protein S18 acetylase RimI n=1 Tax=Pseudomonas jinjuensis TaxID=198616 RepID=A0A1H0KPY2_9PSED|nr:GNAT family N-acetyltransferase [Pseudomonas jinjuensis]SDO57856.1 Ribosomal protein S18 acetylase RimI [Pseudomonas jinjuensis]
MSALEIRPLTPDDHEVWMQLWKGYQRFYNTEIDDATSAVTWQRFLDPAEPMHAALAWQDGQAVGLVHWVFHRSTWTQGDYCYLQDLFVAKGLRGGGVGRKLIEHVYAQAQAHGASRVHWLTHETNATAMLLYERIAQRSGFVQYRKLL